MAKQISKIVVRCCIAVFMLVMTFMLTTAFFPPARSALNNIYKTIWHITAPKSYYIQFAEIWPGKSFQWEIYVENGETTWYQVTPDNQSSASNFSSENISVDEIFNFIDDNCIYRSFLKCGVTYHYWYKFPKHSVSYEIMMFEVDHFINCTKHPDQCQEKINSPNGGDI